VISWLQRFSFEWVDLCAAYATEAENIASNELAPTVGLCTLNQVDL
jgi:hypothetical protein